MALDDVYKALRSAMICFNAAVMAAGITLVGLAVWVKVGSTSFVRVMGSSFIYFAHTWDFGIAAGCLIIVLGLLGCWSAYKENRCLLMMYFATMLLIFVAEISVVIAVLAFTPFIRSFVQDKALQTLKKKYGGYKYDNIVSYGWNSYMLGQNCCGVHNYTDFKGSAFQKHTNLTYPRSCCKDPKSFDCNGTDINSTIIHMEGCFPKMMTFIWRKTSMMGGIAIMTTLLEVAAMVVSLTLYVKLE
ncbi:tetraspanin-16 [Alligator mississippiensis]|uniref:tetraspanin-16 n=1 Tax=Alligator mississippiensis TaxID=8496 RepID=UPI000711B1DE|nr:tetraspanin-16 [Alligator mississippiensis]